MSCSHEQQIGALEKQIREIQRLVVEQESLLLALLSRQQLILYLCDDDVQDIQVIKPLA